MGISNRQRRARKTQKRANKKRSAGQEHQGHHHPPPRTDDQRATDLLRLVATTPVKGDERVRAEVVRLLADLPVPTVARAIEREIAALFPLVWNDGWLPGEVIRQIRRATSARSGRLGAAAIAIDHQRRDPSTLHPRWQAHVNSLRLPPAPGEGWFRRFVTDADLPWTGGISAALDVFGTIAGLAPLGIIIPPPGSSADSASFSDLATASAGSDAEIDPVLEKVRGLLAKAESTSFEAEAEAFTAKAQELMARHAIDAALLWARSARGEEPTVVRIAVDDPYAEAKQLLLHIVAKHSRCRAVIYDGYAMSAVIGFANDLTATEVLFTSLLVQAQSSMQRLVATSPPGSRPRSRPFKTSFLVSYANRIGQRLSEINDEITATAEQEVGTSLVPVLAERDIEVDAKLDAEFGEIRTSPVRGGHDWYGWDAGSEAADAAHFPGGAIDAPPSV